MEELLQQLEDIKCQVETLFDELALIEYERQIADEDLTVMTNERDEAIEKVKELEAHYAGIPELLYAREDAMNDIHHMLNLGKQTEAARSTGRTRQLTQAIVEILT